MPSCKSPGDDTLHSAAAMPPGSQEPQGLDWQTLGGLDRHRFELFIEDFEENAEHRLGLGLVSCTPLGLQWLQ